MNTMYLLVNNRTSTYSFQIDEIKQNYVQVCNRLQISFQKPFDLMNQDDNLYEGSTWGRIADILMDADCMNPILLFDELDKVQSNEIAGILTHLTDPSQNQEFNDRYFDGVPLDLSKALMVFTFNDASKIDPPTRISCKFKNFS